MERNPFTYEFRKHLLVEALKESGWDDEDIARIHISGLKDWSMESDAESNSRWGWYLYCNIVNLTGNDKFAIYYSDKLEDIRSWFADPYFALDSEDPKVIIQHFIRQDLFEGLSATKVRKALMSNDSDGLLYLIKFCPNVIIENIELIREILQRIKKNPKKDTAIVKEKKK